MHKLTHPAHTTSAIILYRSGSSCNELTSVLIALEKVIESPPKLEDYLALNDSIVQLILNCTQCTEDNKIPLQASYELKIMYA